MFRRKFSVLASAISALVSLNCFGLGLGEIAVKSSLGEPLVAVIPMTDVAALTGENIAVTLASKDDFELVGIDMASELGKLSFSVDLSSVTEPVIRVYSRQPMENPYLSLLIDVQWPSGRLVREYSLHLEQPVFLEGGASPTSSVLAPTSGGAAPSTRRKIGLSAFQVDPQTEKDKYQAKESAIPAAPIIRPTMRSAPQRQRPRCRQTMMLEEQAKNCPASRPPTWKATPSKPETPFGQSPLDSQ
jgi:pilus assembly protein FimV